MKFSNLMNAAGRMCLDRRCSSRIQGVGPLLGKMPEIHRTKCAGPEIPGSTVGQASTLPLANAGVGQDLGSSGHGPSGDLARQICHPIGGTALQVSHAGRAPTRGARGHGASPQTPATCGVSALWMIQVLAGHHTRFPESEDFTTAQYAIREAAPVSC